MSIKSTRAAEVAGAATAATAPADGALLSLRSAKVLVADGGETLLDVPSLDLFPGERVVVTGPSGSGKSLLLSTFTGRWAPGLRFEGRRTASFTKIGFVPQRGLDALHPLSKLGRQLQRVTAQGGERVAEVLTAAGLADPELRRRRPTELSGGQAQRAAVALAVLTGAPLILADEPTSALDHDTRDQILQLLDEILDEQQTLVLTTHDSTVAQAMATRRIVVNAGAVTVTEVLPSAPQPEGARS